VLCAFDNYANSGEPFDVKAMLALTDVTSELDNTYIPLRSDEHRALIAYVPRLFENRPALNHLLATGCDDPDDGESQLRYLKRLRRFLVLCLWIKGQSLDDIERQIHTRDLATQPLLSAIERTSDLMRPVAALVALPLAARGVDGVALSRLVHAVRVRLEHGIREEALPLARLDLGLSRSDMHELLNAGFDSASKLKEALDRDDPVLLALVSPDGLVRLRAELAKRPRDRQTREEELAELLAGMTL
jgi:hypothetical protein